MMKSICVLAATLLLAGLAGEAGAVSPLGKPKRVDVDPKTDWYGFFSYTVVATDTGGFAVAWEEDNKKDPDFFPAIEGLKFRVFTAKPAPVADPQSANLTNRTSPGVIRLMRIGAGKAYLAYGLTKKISDTEFQRESWGQAITLATGAGAPRKLLTADDPFASRAAGLSDGRAIFAWFTGLPSAVNPSTIPGRFISEAGTPQAIDLDIALPEDGFALAGIEPLDKGFVVLYRRFDTALEVRARVLKANGAAAGPAQSLDPGVTGLPLLATFPDGRILVATWIAGASQFDLVGQLYDKTWNRIGAKKTLISAGAVNDRVDFAALPDGGLLLARTYGAFPTYTHTVSRFGKSLKPAGTTYAFPSLGFDFAHIAALNATTAVIVFKENIGGRSRLTAQLLKLN
jgi:hypothetical protein